MQYPVDATQNPIATYTYGYDSMGRLNTMTDQSSNTLVSGVTYNAANQMLTLSGSVLSETRLYNANLQMKELTSGSYHYKYNYSATQNNGRITSMQDIISGETITYQYDSLNRLMTAAGTGDAQGAWSQTFTYDGFGNLTQKAGSNAPNDGNMTQYGPTGSIQHFSFDVANRLTVGPSLVGASSTYYGYDAANHRVYAGTGSGSTYSGESIYFYGADGKKLGVWTVSYQGSAAILTNASINQWFGGRLLKAEDRLQSRGKYFPYGEDRYSPSSANPAKDTEKFATYTRDSASGLDYANQRYYAGSLSRFPSTDPYQARGGLRDPKSWNRYVYVNDDPINYNDANGADLEYIGSSTYLGGRAN